MVFNKSSEFKNCTDIGLVQFCNRQVELNTLPQIRFNSSSQLRLNTLFFKQRSSVFHSDTVLILVEGNDFTSMKEAIQDRRGECCIAQKLAPFIGTLIRCQDERRFVIHIIDELEEQLRILGFISHIHDVIDDD